MYQTYMSIYYLCVGVYLEGDHCEDKLRDSGDLICGLVLFKFC